MIKNLTITITVENSSDDPDLLCEHGLSIYIQADDRKILVDAGQSEVLFNNSKKLGIDLTTLNELVISHGHFDHTGAISGLLEINPSFSVLCHPDIFLQRYSLQIDGTMKPVSINEKASESLHSNEHRITWIKGPTYLNRDIGITGPIPRMSFENTGGQFFMDCQRNRRDMISDDIALWFQTDRGLTIVTGCCHSGIINTVSYIQRETGNIPVHTIIGGFHLVNATDHRIDATIDFLQSINIQNIIPCHCTGQHAIDRLKNAFGNKVMHCKTGYKYSDKA